MDLFEGTPGATVSPAGPAKEPQLGYVVFWGVTSTGASISWSTNVPATTELAYGTSKNLGQFLPAQKSLTTAHGVKLTSLSSGTTYYFVAKSADANGAVGSSSFYSFTTLGASNPPAISEIVVKPKRNNQVDISWVTSQPTYSFFQIGLSTKYDRWSTRTPLTTHPHPTIAWVPSGVIHYQLVSTDANDHKTISPDRTFVEP